MSNVRIGDTVTLVAPSGGTRDVVVTDVIRDPFGGAVLAVEFDGNGGPVQLPAKFFRTK